MQTISHKGYTLKPQGPAVWGHHKATVVEVDSMITGFLVKVNGEYTLMGITLKNPCSLTALSNYLEGVAAILSEAGFQKMLKHNL